MCVCELEALSVSESSRLSRASLFFVSVLFAGEHKNLAASNPDVVAELYAALNQTILTLRDCNGWSYQGRPNGKIPGPLQPDNTTSCSPPELIGHCDTKCAQAKWQKYGSHSGDGPHCDVPGCTNVSVFHGD